MEVTQFADRVRYTLWSRQLSGHLRFSLLYSKLFHSHEYHIC